MGEKNRGAEGLHRPCNRYTGRNRVLYGECACGRIVRIGQKVCGYCGTGLDWKETGGLGEEHSLLTIL